MRCRHGSVPTVSSWTAPDVTQRAVSVSPLLSVNLYVHPCSKLKLHQRVNGSFRRIDDVQQALVSANLVLIARVLVDMWRDQDCKSFGFRRQGNWSKHACAGLFRRFYDLLCRFVNQTMIVRL